jgi:hypothetical protein
MRSKVVASAIVATRKSARPAAELLDEWKSNVGPMCDGAPVDVAPPQLAVAALTHEQDIRGALGLPAVIAPEERRFSTTVFASGCGFAVKAAGLPALAIEATDTDFATVAGDGEPGATVAEHLDVGPYLEAFCVFGPLREQDLHEG